MPSPMAPTASTVSSTSSPNSASMAARVGCRRPTLAAIEAEFGEDVEETVDAVGAIGLGINLSFTARGFGWAFAEHDGLAAGRDRQRERGHLGIEHAAVAGAKALDADLDRSGDAGGLEGLAAIGRDLQIHRGIEAVRVAATGRRRLQGLGEE